MQPAFALESLPRAQFDRGPITVRLFDGASGSARASGPATAGPTPAARSIAGRRSAATEGENVRSRPTASTKAVSVDADFQANPVQQPKGLQPLPIVPRVAAKKTVNDEKPLGASVCHQASSRGGFAQVRYRNG
jgi:hypothetical protein